MLNQVAAVLCFSCALYMGMRSYGFTPYVYDRMRGTTVFAMSIGILGGITNTVIACL